jgi:tetratricopeptide (TPR) repeat protein
MEAMSLPPKKKPVTDIPNWVYTVADRMGLSIWAKVGEGVGIRKGSVHYYNFEDGISVWTGKFRPEWVKFYDTKHKDYYYSNQFTGECVWDEPKTYTKPPNKALMKFLIVNKDLKAALTIQHAFRAQQARRHAFIEIARAKLETALVNWVTVRDPRSNCDYYFNVISNVGPLWEKPEELEDAELMTPTWCKVYDANREMYYYHNNYTSEIRWTKPDDYRDPPRAALLKGTFMSPELKSAITIQNAYRMRQSRRIAMKQRALNDPDGLAIKGWKKEYSPFHESDYYCNVETGEIVWEKPEAVLNYESNHMPIWVQIYDPHHRKYYYFNNFTQACEWDRPHEYFTPRNKSVEFMKTICMSPEVKSAICIQQAFRKKKDREKLREQHALHDAASAHHNWVAEFDQYTQATYYYHIVTHQVSWEKPAALGGGVNSGISQEWVKVYSPPDKKYYYYSNWTNEVTWERPLGYTDPPKGGAALKHFTMNKELKAAITIQHAFRAKLAREQARHEKAARHADESHNGWVIVHDAYSGKDYYWHKTSGEVSWEKPAELGGGKNEGLLEWVKLYSPRDEKDYYFNNYTEEISWEEPNGFKLVSANVQLMTMSKELRSAIKIQQLYRAKLAREELRKRKVACGKGVPFRGWITEHDRFSGKDYYWHEDTREVTWEKPLILLVPIWVQMFDPETKWHYYVNNDTSEVSWERPDDYKDPLPGANMKMICINPEVRAALVIQGAYRRRQTMLLCIAIHAQKNGTVEEVHGWVELHTAHETEFFWKVGSPRVTCRRPRVLGGGEKGSNAHQTEHYKPSEKFAKRVLELQHILDSDNYDIMKKVELGAIYADDKNYELAIETIMAAQQGGADGHLVYGALGKAYYLLWERDCKYDNLNRAFNCFQKMASRHMRPKAKYLFFMARCYEGFGDYNSAVHLLGDIINEYPEFEDLPEVIFHAACLLKHLGEYSVAQDYLAFLASHPVKKITKELVWFQVAHCFHLQGNDELAQEGLNHLYWTNKFAMRKKGIRSGHEWAQAPETWLEMAYQMKEHHLYLMAADSFKHALARCKVGGVAPDTYLSLSACLHRSHNRTEALHVLESAAVTFEKDEASLAMIMEAYENLSEEYAARRRAEAAAALLISRVIRGRISRKRIAKVKKKLQMIEEAKVAENLRSLFHKKQDKIFHAWYNHTKYVLAIRRFGEKIIGHGIRRCWEGWQNAMSVLRRETSLRIIKASAIQRAFRASRIRTILSRAVKHRKKQEMIIQQCRKHHEKNFCHNILQRWLQYSEKCEKARVMYRRFRERGLVRVMNTWSAEMHHRRGVKNHAATVIQTWGRGWMARIALDKLKKARDFLIGMIQARIRAKLARIKVKVARWKKKVIFRDAATKIQSVMRGFLVRGRIWGKWTHAAILIQAGWRNYCWRRERSQATLTIQRCWDNYQFNKLVLEQWCAMKIAALYRGHLARRWVRMNKASTSISKVYRGHLARVKVAGVKSRLRTFWANLLFQEIDAQHPEAKKNRTLSTHRKHMLTKAGKVVPPDTSRAIYEGNRLSKEIWKRFSCKNVTLIGNVKPVPMPMTGKNGVQWKPRLPTPVYPVDDPARAQLPNIQLFTSPTKKPWQQVEGLNEQSFAGGSPVQAMYIVSKTPEAHSPPSDSPSRMHLPEISTNEKPSINFQKKTLRQRKRLLPMAQDRGLPSTITSKSIINSGDVALLSSFAKLQARLSHRPRPKRKNTRTRR